MRSIKRDRRCGQAAIVTSLVCALALTGCGSSHNTLQLPLEPIPYADTLPIERPKTRQVNEVTRLLKVSVGGEVGFAFSLKRLVGAEQEALNLTRFDDVVSSAWFEHRIGLGGMTPQDVARGPTTVGPDTSRALTVIDGKAAGISPGFTVRDARGTMFLFKFDPKDNLHLASAADVISSRLFYAAGYHTPEDNIVVFDSTRLVVHPEAEITDRGQKRKLTREDIDRVLARTDTLADGRYLALASKIVPGHPLDPFLFSGVRGDDPNDYYHHQYRRELRGLYVVSSWTNHVDMRYANTLDVFIDPPGYVRHYLIDFTATLGSGTIRPHTPREGEEYNFDFWPTAARVFTFGFYRKGWEDMNYELLHPSVGWITVERFDPANWRPNWPNAAFRAVTPADGYWGAKLVGAFTDEHIRAAVKEGGLPVQSAEDILNEILVLRRDTIVAYWYGQVTPIEQVQTRLVGADPPSLEVSFSDLGLAAGVWDARRTRYTWKLEDGYHQVEANGEITARSGDRQVLRVPLEKMEDNSPTAGDSEATATLRVAVSRDGKPVKRQAVIYLRWEGSGYRVVGLKH